MLLATTRNDDSVFLLSSNAKIGRGVRPGRLWKILLDFELERPLSLPDSKWDSLAVHCFQFSKR